MIMFKYRSFPSFENMNMKKYEHLYHATSFSKISSILQNGLHPDYVGTGIDTGDLGYERPRPVGVFLTNSKEQALLYGLKLMDHESKAVILEVDLTDLSGDEIDCCSDSADDTAIVVKTPIAFDRIHLARLMEKDELSSEEEEVNAYNYEQSIRNLNYQF